MTSLCPTPNTNEQTFKFYIKNGNKFGVNYGKQQKNTPEKISIFLIDTSDTVIFESGSLTKKYGFKCQKFHIYPSYKEIMEEIKSYEETMG
jgi:hypothetical protein